MSYNKEEATTTFTNIVDFDHCKVGFLPLADNTKTIQKLRELVEGWSQEERGNFWVDVVKPYIINSQGFFTSDLKTMMKVLGIQSAIFTVHA